MPGRNGHGLGGRVLEAGGRTLRIAGEGPLRASRAARAHPGEAVAVGLLLGAVALGLGLWLRRRRGGGDDDPRGLGPTPPIPTEPPRASGQLPFGAPPALPGPPPPGA